MRYHKSVGSTYWDVFLFLWIGVGLIPVVITVIMWRMGWSASIMLIGLGTGAIPFAIAGVRWVYLFVHRQWLEENRDGGFRLTTWRKSYTFSPAAVRGLGTSVRADVGLRGDSTQTYVKCMTRVATLDLAHSDFPKPHKLRYSWPPDGTDPFARLFDRLADGIAEHAERRVREGGWLTGTGWSLTSDALTIDETQFQIIIPPAFDPTKRVIPLTQLKGVRVTEDTLSLIFGDDEEYLCAPFRGPNAGVMERVLARLLAAPEQPASPPASGWEYADAENGPESTSVATATPEDRQPTVAPTPGTEHPLGRPLFSLGADTNYNPIAGLAGPTTVVYGGFGIVLCAMAVIWYTFSRGNPQTLWGLAVGGGCLAAAVLAEVYRRRIRRSPQMRFYSNGVSYARPGQKVIELRHDQIEEFTYAATNHLVNGEFTFTETKLRFVGWNGTVIAHTERSALEENPHLDEIRDEVARQVAGAMRRRLDAGLTVQWTGRVSFEPDGVCYSPGSKSDDPLIDWDDVLLVNTKPGRFVLMSRRTSRQVTHLATSDANFFPGFFLIEEMRPRG